MTAVPLALRLLMPAIRRIKMRTSSRRFAHIVALPMALLLASCIDPLAPFSPEITNATDNFQLQATGVVGVTSILTYAWVNTGTRATINHSTTTTAGSAVLSVRDAAGIIVYDKALVPSLNEPTSSGTAGTWTIQLRMSDYNGTLNFRAQKL